jgi:hypothetical protein
MLILSSKIFANENILMSQHRSKIKQNLSSVYFAH